MTPVLEIDVRHQLGTARISARLTASGPVTALFGRSGSGKTSLVNLIAGLIRPDEGRITLNGRVLADTATGTFVPAHRRRIGYVFQEGRLFPHLTVRQNLLYGRWMAGLRGHEGDVDRVVELLGVAPLLTRWPAGLSGGEKQRVAIGRALLSRPDLLLMDEPLASLDEERKGEILAYIETICAATRLPVVYVSHSMAEIVRIASHMAIMEAGTMVRFGPLAEVLPGLGGTFGEPSTLIEATVTGFDAAYGLVHLHTGFGRFEILREGLTAGQRVRLRLLASDVMLATVRPGSVSAQNIVGGRIGRLDPVDGAGGGRCDVQVTAGGAMLIARITAKAVEDLGLKPGMDVFAVVKSVAIES